jgi:hypothetical protein
MSENALELAVHVASAGHGADAAALTDSASFMSTVRKLSPDTPGFVTRVADAVRDAVATNSALRAGGAAPAPLQPEPELAVAVDMAGAPPLAPAIAQLARQTSRRAALTRDYRGEITVQDVKDAAPAVAAEWAHSGRLVHLGIPAQRRRGTR